MTTAGTQHFRELLLEQPCERIARGPVVRTTAVQAEVPLQRVLVVRQAQLRRVNFETEVWITGMSIKVTCNACGQTATAPDSAAGARGRCRKCGGVVKVPTARGAELSCAGDAYDLAPSGTENYVAPPQGMGFID